MKNINLALDKKMAEWLRLNAAKQGVSVSRLLRDLIHGQMREALDYNEAMRQFLAEKPFHFGWADGRRATREEIHERATDRQDLAGENLARRQDK